MPLHRSLTFFCLVLCLSSLQAGDWTLVKVQGHWGLRVQENQILSVDGRLVDVGGKATDSVDLQMCSDSLQILPTSPDTIASYEQETRSLAGPFRFGNWTRSSTHSSHLDLMAGTGIESPWRKVHGKDDSGFMNPLGMDFCPGTHWLERLDRPTLIRPPFLSLGTTILSSPAQAPRWRRVATGQDRLVPWPGDTSFAAMVPDTAAEDDFGKAQWLVIWPRASDLRWIAGKGNLVQVRVPGARSRFLHFQDGYPRIAQRVERLGVRDLVLEWTAVYGDGNWDEIARIGSDKIRLMVNGGVSGGEGHEISPEEEKLAASGTWRIDPKSGKILLKKWRQREKAILDR